MNATKQAQPTKPASMRPFFAVWSGQVFSLLGSELVQFALVWWLTQESGGSATTLAAASLVAKRTDDRWLQLARRWMLWGWLFLSLGLILGAINSKRAGNKAKAVENMAKIAGIFVLLVFVGRLVQLLPPVFNTVGITLLVVFVALMFYQVIHRPTHGLLLPLEVLGTVGNILSYIRIRQSSYVHTIFSGSVTK